MSSPTTASRCRATRTTPCCKAMCSKCTSRTAWPAWPSGTWAAAASTTKPSPARARTRSRSRRCRSRRPPNIRARIRTRRWTCTWRCGPRLQADSKLRFIYDLEMRSSEALYRVERNGVLIDGPILAKQSAELGQRMMQLEKEAHDLAGQPFNLGSPKQIGEILFTKLGLPVVKKTPSGVASTDEEVLEKLAEDYPLPAKLLEHRGLSKLKGTYTDKLAQMAHPRTGRVHTHYAQAVAVTGRLSSNEPNLQNIPVKTAEGPARARSLHRAARPLHRQRRLQPDRAAHHGAPERGRGAAARVPRRHGRAPRHRGRSVRRGAGPGEQRAAPLRQGDQLRPDLRHERVRPGAQPGHRRRGGQELHPALFRALSRASSSTWTRRASRPRARAMSRPCSAGACTCPRSIHRTARAAAAPSAPPSTRRCRARPPT